MIVITMLIVEDKDYEKQILTINHSTFFDDSFS